MKRQVFSDEIERLVAAELSPLYARVATLEREIAALQASIAEHEWRVAAVVAAEMDAASPHPPSSAAN
ncbi:MAG: hypothetical protein ACR65U_01795 [Methylocystis sp.]